MSRCSKCKKKITPGAKFCRKCGTKIEEPIVEAVTTTKVVDTKMCAACGYKQNALTAKYCRKCGEKLQEAVVPPPLTEPEVMEPTPQIPLCRKCKNPLAPNAKFCNRCGYSADDAGANVEHDVSPVIEEASVNPPVPETQSEAAEIDGASYFRKCKDLG